MRRVAVLSGVVTVLAFVGATSAAPTSINIDARTNHVLNPVEVDFEKGTYTLDPIGVADGGLYNAMSWGPGQGPGRYRSWDWCYYMESPEFGIVYIDDPLRTWSDYEMDAFATAVSTTFSLSADATVKFYIMDGPGGWQWAGDNIGGMSLSVRPVPAPCAILLGGIGVGLIGWLRRHRVV